ncbi:gluconate 2-dehydrogenase subunit 3 family protein [Marinoscillum sp.]|uniref:gluconate 2-dehydrogenase subunit 3 family protein n=1 Tax=Marinoscillum sp. TaxID=2024838 RepID=UPI003BA9F096
MDRRKAIINMSMGAAGIGLSSSFISLMSSCSQPATLTYAALTFDAQQDTLVQQLVELIIPTTDTPGAKAAKVNEYIDRVLALVRDSSETNLFLQGLGNLEKDSFLSQTKSDQITYLSKLEQEGMETSELTFFKLLKSMTIYGYYTSEIGATQELSYVHATGRYDGDYPYSEIGKNYY